MMKIFCTFFVAMSIVGCSHTSSAGYDRFRLKECEIMERSLRADYNFSFGGIFAGFGLDLGLKRRVKNKITEERLVSFNALIGDCRQWARREMSSEKYADLRQRYGGIFAASEEIDEIDEAIEIIESRVQLFEEALSKAGTDTSDINFDKLREDAVAFSALGRDAPSKMRQANKEIAAASASGTGVSSNRVSHLESELIEVGTRLFSIEQQLELSTRIAAVTSNDLFGPDNVVGTVFFDTGDRSVSDFEASNIREMFERSGQDSFVVVGYADRSGEAKGNLVLSRARALNVARVLSKAGAQFIEYRGMGETDRYRGGLSANRRVQILTFGRFPPS